MADEVAEEMVECADGEMRPREECVECYDGEWRPVDECVRCADDEWRAEDDCTQCSNGQWYPDDEVITLACGDIAHVDNDNIVQRADGESAWECNCTQVGRYWYDEGECCHCEDCNEAMLNDNAQYGPDDAHYCDSCYDERFTSCDNCGETVDRHDLNCTDDGDLCERCYEECEDKLILNYSDRSANKLRPETKDKLKFGIELEVESKTSDEDGAKYVRGCMADDYCVFKHDGSLGDGGFEIATRPDSVAVHKRKWETLLNDTPGKRLRSWVGGRCGMHVHVTKSALSQLQLGKMLCFLNEPSNAAFVASVAGRLPCHWCKVSPKKLSDVKLPAERYVALNITDRTAEFRIFRGTLLGSSFYKNLEFVQAVVEFCSPAARSISDAVSHKAFCDWLSKRDYPNLHAFLVAKGYIREAGRKAG